MRCNILWISYIIPYPIIFQRTSLSKVCICLTIALPPEIIQCSVHTPSLLTNNKTHRSRWQYPYNRWVYYPLVHKVQLPKNYPELCYDNPRGEPNVHR